MAYELMTDEQRDLVEMLHDFQVKELLPKVHEIDEKGEFPMDVHDKLGELGFHGLDLPAEYGGCGFDEVTNYLIREEFGMVDAGFGFSYTLSKSGAATVIKHGTDEQKKWICERILGGAIACNCITEADAGSEVTNIKTHAEKKGDKWILNGTKCFITNGPIADIYMVIAYTDKSAGPKGMSLFMVPREAGVEVGKHENKMGLRSSVTGEVIFNDVELPESALVGPEGRGYANILANLTRNRILNTSIVVGTAQHALNEAAAYANQRVTFGKQIKDHQAVQFMLADMEQKIQASRNYLIYGANLLQNGAARDAISSAASGAKVFASDCAVQVCLDAIQIMGGYGYSREYPVEKLLRDAKIFQIFEGTNQINRMVQGKIVGKA